MSPPKNPRHVAPFEIFQDGVGQIEVEETNLLGRGAGGVVCRASHKPTGESPWLLGGLFFSLFGKS